MREGIVESPTTIGRRDFCGKMGNSDPGLNIGLDYLRVGNNPTVLSIEIMSDFIQGRNCPDRVRGREISEDIVLFMYLGVTRK